MFLIYFLLCPSPFFPFLSLLLQWAKATGLRTQTRSRCWCGYTASLVGHWRSLILSFFLSVSLLLLLLLLLTRGASSPIMSGTHTPIPDCGRGGGGARLACPGQDPRRGSSSRWLGSGGGGKNYVQPTADDETLVLPWPPTPPTQIRAPSGRRLPPPYIISPPPLTHLHTTHTMHATACRDCESSPEIWDGAASCSGGFYMVSVRLATLCMCN